MTYRPDIPKRLAAKIRVAQARLEETLAQIAASDFNTRQHQARLAEFDADPAAFANKHYPRHAVDSYHCYSLTQVGQALGYKNWHPADQLILG